MGLMSDDYGLLAAPPILSNVPGSFSWGVLERRHPALIDQVAAAHPYPPHVHRGLDQLRKHIGGPIAPLPASAHDKEAWDTWGNDYFGTPWPDVPFLWAESYFYRLLLDAVGYFAPGPWQGIDPFGPQKTAELGADSLTVELAALDGLAAQAPRARARALIGAALWGNRADLGFRLSDPESTTRDRESDLIIDETDLILDHLEAHPAATVCVVADNAGRELIPDLVLIDDILISNPGRLVDLHLKPTPYYVSDATTQDLLAALATLAASSGEAVRSGQRLWRAITAGRLRVTTHPFYCAPLPFCQMPDDLAASFAAAELTIVKGDLNYRRLVGDNHWAPTTAYADLTAYFPGPVAALRTLKSELAIGLDTATVASLDAATPDWRTSGTYALIQGRI